MSRLGKPNRNKQRLLKALQDEYGEDFNPVMAMAKNANRLQIIADEFYDEDKSLIEESDLEGGTVKVTDKINTAIVAQNAWGKIAKFVTPELKAIELTGGDGGPLQVEEVRRAIVDPDNTDS